MLGRRVICPSEPAYHIVDCRIYDQNASVSEPDQTWLYETSVLLYCMCSVKCIFTCWKKHTSSCGFTCNWCGILMVQKYCSILFFRFFFHTVLIKKKYRQWKTITDFSQYSKGQVINPWIFYDKVRNIWFLSPSKNTNTSVVIRLVLPERKKKMDWYKKKLEIMLSN